MEPTDRTDPKAISPGQKDLIPSKTPCCHPGTAAHHPKAGDSNPLPPSPGRSLEPIPPRGSFLSRCTFLRRKRKPFCLPNSSLLPGFSLGWGSPRRGGIEKSFRGARAYSPVRQTLIFHVSRTVSSSFFTVVSRRIHVGETGNQVPVSAG
jgi:hypothetical protein